MAWARTKLSAVVCPLCKVVRPPSLASLPLPAPPSPTQPHPAPPRATHYLHAPIPHCHHVAAGPCLRRQVIVIT